MVRRRNKEPPSGARAAAKPPSAQSSPSDEKKKMADSSTRLRVGGGSPSAWSQRSQWMFFAVASGACAAFNGVFAKLTTTKLTTSLSQSIANGLGLSDIENAVEVVVRAIFFVLNLTFNGVMWSLFTTALARGTSTTQVSIMNTSTNFMLTAVLGSLIFSEILPPMWWAGAVLLVIGNVIVGRKDETKEQNVAEGEYAPVSSEDELAEQGRKEDEDEDEDVIDLGDITGERDHS